MTGDAVSIEVFGSDLDALRDSAQKITALLENTEGVTEIDDGLGKKTPELRITVDKTAAIKKGLTTGQIYAAVQQEIKQPSAATSLTQNGSTYEIYVHSGDTVNEKTLRQMKVENAQGKSVSLSDVADFSMEQGFDSITRSGQERYVTVSAQLLKGYNIGKINQALERQLEALSLPDGCRVQMAGQNEMIEDTFSNLLLMMALAVVFIYLVMVAQFQSLLSPFIIMFTIPLAFTGGFLALMLTGNPVSTVALIGLHHSGRDRGKQRHCLCGLCQSAAPGGSKYPVRPFAGRERPPAPHFDDGAYHHHRHVHHVFGSQRRRCHDAPHGHHHHRRTDLCHPAYPLSGACVVSIDA